MKITMKLGELSIKEGSTEGKVENAEIECEYSLEEIQEINKSQKEVFEIIGNGIKYLLDNAPKHIKEISGAISSIKERNDNGSATVSTEP